MPEQESEDFDGLHERVLRFMGAFSSTQFAIDTVVSMYLHSKMPALGPMLEKQFLKRIRDDQRLPVFRAFATEVGYEGDLGNFEQIYVRAKQLRDLLGHSLNVVGPVYSADVPPYVAVTRSSTVKVNLLPEPLLPSTFIRFTADCEWLTQHVWRAGYVARPDMFMDFQGRPSEPPAPPTLPNGGEPLTSRVRL